MESFLKNKGQGDIKLSLVTVSGPVVRCYGISHFRGNIKHRSYLETPLGSYFKTHTDLNGERIISLG